MSKQEKRANKWPWVRTRSTPEPVQEISDPQPDSMIAPARRSRSDTSALISARRKAIDEPRPERLSRSITGNSGGDAKEKRREASLRMAMGDYDPPSSCGTNFGSVVDD
ncbi:g956 [Coccomyxa elongata]